MDSHQSIRTELEDRIGWITKAQKELLKDGESKPIRKTWTKLQVMKVEILRQLTRMRLDDPAWKAAIKKLDRVSAKLEKEAQKMPTATSKLKAANKLLGLADDLLDIIPG